MSIIYDKPTKTFFLHGPTSTYAFTIGHLGTLLQLHWGARLREVLINNWEVTYFDFDAEKLLAIASAALGPTIPQVAISIIKPDCLPRLFVPMIGLFPR